MLTVLAKAAVVAVFATVVVFVGYVLWRALFFPSEPNDRSDTAQIQEQQQEGPDKVASPILPKGSADERIADYTLALAVFTAFLVLISGIQIAYLIRAEGIAAKTAQAAKNAADAATASANAAVEANQLSREAFVIGQRPWVKVDIEVGGPFFYNVNGANFTIRFRLKNIGKSPATHVWISPEMVAPLFAVGSNFDPRGTLSASIARLKSGPFSTTGYTIFPDDTITQDFTVSIGPEDLKKIAEKMEFIVPSIVGAVDYGSLFDTLHHNTGFVVDVRRSDAPRAISTEKHRSPAAIFPDEGDIPVAEIRLFRSFIGGEYVD